MKKTDISSNHVFHCATSLYSFSPSEVSYPRTETEIVQIIQAAAQRNIKVRVIGALHSQAPIPATSGICVVLDKYKNVLNIKDSLVTVQAGIKIWELNQILAKHNLALPTLGGIDRQTVSGAISTGTHGGSLYHKSLSSYVESLRIIRADGSILEVDSSDYLFNAVGISMGLLGVTSTITFKCVPAFSLQSRVYSMSMDVLLQKFDEINRKNKYVDIKYSPIADSAQVLLMNPTKERIENNGGWNPQKKSKARRRLENLITASAMRLFHTHKFNWLQRPLVENYEKTAYASPFGSSDFVLTHFEAANDDLDELIPVSDMEIAIPYSQATNALTYLRNNFQKTQKFPSMSVHIRCSDSEDFWLSPAYGEPICWIEFWEYPRTGEFFTEMVEVLKRFRCRYHWGKQIPTQVNLKYLKQQYEKWHDFIQLKKEWDSLDIFLNPCLERYFYS